MRKFINVFGNTNYDKDILDSADNFGDFIDANLIPENGFDSPIYVMWELTSVCPNKCIYCYNDSHNKNRNELNKTDFCYCR